GPHARPARQARTPGPHARPARQARTPATLPCWTWRKAARHRAEGAWAVDEAATKETFDDGDLCCGLVIRRDRLCAMPGRGSHAPKWDRDSVSKQEPQVERDSAALTSPRSRRSAPQWRQRAASRRPPGLRKAKRSAWADHLVSPATAQY